MTAYIDNIIIQGTPEEIQEFIELQKSNEGVTVPGGWTIQSDVRYKLCPICYSSPCGCTTGNAGIDCTTTTKKVDATNTIKIETDGAFIPDHMYFKT